jgi:hypothetical protein
VEVVAVCGGGSSRVASWVVVIGVSCVGDGAGVLGTAAPSVEVAGI